MSRSDSRSLGWCFTINNPDPDNDSLVELGSHAQYFVVGKEVGEEGTPHLQGYAYFKTKKSLQQLKELLPRAHLERQKGSFEQAIEYCKKDGDFLEVGEMPMTKKRKGEKGREFWEEQLSLAKRGKIEEMDPKVVITHYSTIVKLHTRFAEMPDDLEETTGVWYWGATGTGKSRKARTENPGAYLKLCNKWWDNYQDQEVVIIEDFDKCHSMLGYHLKIWADMYAFSAEIKGSQINIRPKKIIVTSNYHPRDIWGTDPQTLEPIERRYKITHFN